MASTNVLTRKAPHAELAGSAIDAIVEQIEELKLLQADWDDQGAREVSRRAIVTAIRLANDVNARSPERTVTQARIPAVFPTHEGGVQFYWSVDDMQVAITLSPGKEHIVVDKKIRDQPQASEPVTLEQAASAFVAMLWSAPKVANHGQGG